MLSDSTNGGDTTGSMLTTLNILRTIRERMFTYTSTYANKRPSIAEPMPTIKPSPSVLVNALRNRPISSTRANTSSVTFPSETTLSIKSIARG